MTLHVVKLKASLLKFDGRYHNLINRYGYLCHTWPCLYSICRTHNPDLSSFITYHRDGNKGSFCSIFYFVDRCLSFCPFSFSHLLITKMKEKNNDLQNTTQKTRLKSGEIQFLRKGRQLLHLWWELRLHMCTVLSFSLLNTRLQELILSPVLSYLYNCVWFKDDNHFVGKSLKLETILIVYVIYKLTLSCYIL
jgi:hypothetical protein